MDAIIFACLRDTLASLYSEEQRIRTVIDDAEINAALIAFSAVAKQVWHSVLKEADKTDRVDALLGVVDKEYGRSKDFQKVYEAYKCAKPFDIFSQENSVNSTEIERLNIKEYTVSIIEDKEKGISNLKNPLPRDPNALSSWFFKELRPKEQSLLFATALFAGMNRQKLLEIAADIEKLLTIDDELS